MTKPLSYMKNGEQMKILMVNKFLYPNGGSETYMLRLGEYLTSLGHSVEYFGMEHKDNCVSNSAEAYTENMDFHNSGALKKIKLSLKTVYSKEARQKLRLVLDSFQPDVMHLNNFNYQLTPSIILEARKWEKENGRSLKIVYTAHDYQLICPNHMMYNDDSICEKCLGGKFLNCTKGRCVHSSLLKSAVGTAEAFYWNKNKVYEQLDSVICCSEFMKSRLDTNPVFKGKTVAIHNFIEKIEAPNCEKEDYVLYFGRFSKEKGIDTILKTKGVKFLAAGSGPLEDEIKGADNVEFVGFKTGSELAELIAKARLTVYPSIWYENCPFSVMESISCGTPVVASRIGGIPELIDDGKTGTLFEAGNERQFEAAIKSLTENDEKAAQMSKFCAEAAFETIEDYTEKLIEIYKN